MADFLIDDIFGGAREEMDALSQSAAKLRESLLGLNSVNEVSDDQFSELVVRVGALEKAIDKLSEANKRLAQEERDGIARSREKSTADTDELNRMNEFYRQMERRQQIVRSYNEQQKALVVQQRASAEATKAQAQAASEYTKAQAAQIGQTSIELVQMREYYAELERRSSAEEKKRKQTQQYRVDQKALQDVERLTAIVSSEHTTELEKQDARVRLLNRELQTIIKTHGTESDLYIQKSKAMQGAIDEYARMQQASGQMAMSQTKAYGATFSLTQIMRELPNFAMDARIGFMSLSNNIPMFVSDFERMTKAIDANTGRMLGWGGATRIMLRSLLSLNTIAVIAATLFVAFGDQLGKLFTPRVDAATKATREFYKELREGNGDVVEAQKDLLSLVAVMDSARRGYISQKDALQEYNKQFENLSGRASTFEEAQQRLINITPVYVEAMAKRAYANHLLAEASAAYTRALAIQENKEINFWQRLGAVLSIPILSEGQTLDEWILGRRAGKASKEMDDFRKGAEAFFKSYKDFAEFAKRNGLDFWGDDLKKGSGGIVQQGQAILRQFSTFSEERIKISEKIRDEELKTSRESLQGQLQDFEERARAAEALYNFSAEAAKMDLDMEIANADEKMRVGLLRINDTRAKNQVLYNSGKITYARYQELEKQWSEASKAITSERNRAVLKAQDDWSETSLGNLRQFYQNFLSVQNDMYERETVGIQLNLDNRLAAIDRAYATAQGMISSGSRSAAMEILGFSDTSVNMQNLDLQRRYNQDKLDVQLDAINQQLALVRKGSEEEQSLLDEQRSLRQQKENQYAQDSIELKKAEVELRKDLEVEAAQQTVELVSEIWDTFFKLQLEKLEQQRERIANIEDERMKDIADREKAGVISSEEAEEEKARMKDYYKSLQDDLDRREKEQERSKFLWEQAAALAQVWVNWAIAVANPGNILAFGAFTPMYTAIASISSAMIAAQTIPYFAHGGEMDHDGLAVLGDGGRRELGITPSGRMFITPGIPTLYNLEAGTHIFPDADKVDINSVLSRGASINVMQGPDNALVISELKGLRDDMRKRRPATTGSILRQMDMADRMSRRRRGI